MIGVRKLTYLTTYEMLLNNNLHYKMVMWNQIECLIRLGDLQQQRSKYVGRRVRFVVPRSSYSATHCSEWRDWKERRERKVKERFLHLAREKRTFIGLLFLLSFNHLPSFTICLPPDPQSSVPLIPPPSLTTILTKNLPKTPSKGKPRKNFKYMAAV